MAFNCLKKHLIRNLYQFIHRKSHTEVASASVRNDLQGGRTKVEKAPFMKNVFLGIVDDDILAFPEVELPQDDVLVEDKLRLETKAIIGEETPFLRLLRSGICRLGTPEVYGGIPSSSTHLMRHSEKLEINPYTSFLIQTQYSSIIETLLKFGSERQKDLYLRDLISGTVTGAYAVHEEEAGSDPPSLKCTVIQSDHSEESSFILNGEKTWIANASSAKFFIVLAQHKELNRPSVERQLSAFIVERETPGVTVKKLENVVSECDVYHLKFDDVLLTNHSLLGSVGDGYDIAVKNLESCKFIFTASIINLIRQLLSLVTDQVSQTNRFPMPLREYELVQCRLSKVTATLFALESTVYLLTGMKDLYEMDTTLESVIVQNLICTYGMNAINDCINIAGIRAFDSSYPYQSMIDNLPLIFRSFVSPEIFRLYISLKALEYAGNTLADTVKKLRNPLNFPGFMFKRMLYLRGQSADSPKLDKQLYMKVHPSLKINADRLEYCVLRLQYCTECLLSHHGQEVVQRQLDLVRLSDIAVDIFTMFAVLSRTSRSYCIGTRYADQELLVASIWYQEALQRIKMNVSDIIGGKVMVSDPTLLKLTPDILQNKGYFFVSPVEKTIH